MKFCILFVKLTEDFRGDVSKLCSLHTYRDFLTCLTSSSIGLEENVIFE